MVSFILAQKKVLFTCLPYPWPDPQYESIVLPIQFPDNLGEKYLPGWLFTRLSQFKIFTWLVWGLQGWSGKRLGVWGCSLCYKAGKQWPYFFWKHHLGWGRCSGDLILSEFLPKLNAISKTPGANELLRSVVSVWLRELSVPQSIVARLAKLIRLQSVWPALCPKNPPTWSTLM